MVGVGQQIAPSQAGSGSPSEQQALICSSLVVSFCCSLFPKRPATQQPIEAFHAFFKRSLRSQSHTDVVQALSDSVGAWSAPLRENEELGSKLTSLMAPPEVMSFQRPKSPDSWDAVNGPGAQGTIWQAQVLPRHCSPGQTAENAEQQARRPGLVQVSGCITLS